MESLLLEIGTEEIPAGYMEPALDALSSGLVKELERERIEHGKTETFGTPRRITVKIDDLAPRQSPVTTRIIGPPERIGFDSEGRPAVPGIKFAEKAGIPIQKVFVEETKKGRYLCAEKKEKGAASITVLKEILPKVILSIPFPKTMRWADLSIEFARPVHWIAALLGPKVIGFTLGGIKSGRYTFGHRFMAPARIRLSDPSVYPDILVSAHVIADIDRRKEAVEKGIEAAASGISKMVLLDDELVETVTHLVEEPSPVVGNFDTRFLDLPREILITAMREHQKYFAVKDSTGDLCPNFIAVNNTRARDMDLVARGHERVLRARLEDAVFFYKTDLESTIDTMVEKLKDVLFQADLGNVHEKIERVSDLCGFVSDLEVTDDFVKANSQRAAWLSKADLVSHVVVEFPKLQGVMGRVYAKAAGEPDEVALAIEEHYRPVYSGAPLPDSEAGAILAICDKMDSICGCFSLGMIPTGASDPYALRRQGIGIIQIILKNGFNFSLENLIQKSVGLFPRGNEEEKAMVGKKVYGFLKDRMAHILAEEGFRKDIISAVLSISASRVPNVWKRVAALENLKKKPDFESLASAFKRVANIIRKSKEDRNRTVDQALFMEDSEKDLWKDICGVQARVEAGLDAGDFNRAMLDIATLRPGVDRFFDEVLVMAEEPDIRANRFALLGTISGLFERIADFSKISA